MDMSQELACTISVLLISRHGQAETSHVSAAHRFGSSLADRGHNVTSDVNLLSNVGAKIFLQISWPVAKECISEAIF